GYLFALPLPRLLGVDRLWGVAGLTFSAGLAGWVEFTLLRRKLHQRIGAVASQRSRVARLWGAAIVAALIAYGVKVVLPLHEIRYVSLIRGAIVLPLYGVLYLLLCRVLGIVAPASVQRLLRRG
ncbi:MAG TPA: hypothetical protein VK596_09610, partial [Edaphobacter sp.]|nr:hypothetical protein [Edaphobacter sp.]